MNSILEEITHYKMEEVAQAKRNKPLSTMIQSVNRRNFIKALKQQSAPAIIAEIKKASPSKGIIREDFNVAELARTYAQYGASCLSVLTDQHFFQGHPDYLYQAKDQCSIPVLRKDFIIDPYQIHESLALGADCILLIAALLDEVQLADFCILAQELGMAVLVESHNREELDRALDLPTPLIGINNRSLHTFHTDIQLSIDLASYVPKDKLIISESGIHTREDIILLQEHGINAFLIGEHFMRAPHVGKALEELVGNCRL